MQNFIPAKAWSRMFALLGVMWSLNGGIAQAQDTSMLITLTGQSMIRSDLRATAPSEVPVIQSLLKGDVKFTNFEAVVAEKGQTVSQGRGFLAPPQALDSLSAFGFNLLALSNNHAFDLKATGIYNTLTEVNKRMIVHAGIGNTLPEAAAPAYLHTPKGIVALVASASGLIEDGAHATDTSAGVNELRIEAANTQNESRFELPANAQNTPNKQDAQRILKSIRQARAHSDLVIVYQHNHVFGHRPFSALFEEGLPERLSPPNWLRNWTHQEIDAGADIVVMHGAPLLHGVEIYRGKPIFYDLGNFIYNLEPTVTYIDEPINWESVVAYVQFQHHKLQSISLRPIAMNPIGEGQPDVHNPYTNNAFLDTRGLPHPVTGMKAAYILQRIRDLSKPFGTTILIQGDTADIQLNAHK